MQLYSKTQVSSILSALTVGFSAGFVLLLVLSVLAIKISLYASQCNYNTSVSPNGLLHNFNLSTAFSLTHFVSIWLNANCLQHMHTDANMHAYKQPKKPDLCMTSSICFLLTETGAC